MDGMNGIRLDGIPDQDPVAEGTQPVPAQETGQPERTDHFAVDPDWFGAMEFKNQVGRSMSGS